MNKKAQFDLGGKTIFWMISIVIISMIVLAFALTIGSYRGQLTKVSTKLLSEVTALRFTNNPDCFALKDENTGRVYAGIIDLKRFNQTVLNECYLTEETAKGIRSLNFKLILKNNGKEISTNNYFNYNKDELTIFKEILIWKDHQLSQEELVIFVQEI